MKKKYFMNVQVGDVVFLKDVDQIKRMKQWDGTYFEDDTGSLWCKFVNSRSSFENGGILVLRRNSYHTDALTVDDGNSIFEVPRKCLRNSIIRCGKELLNENN